VKDAMLTVPYGDRDAMVNAIIGAIKQGGLFAVDVDMVPPKIGQACHVWLPVATAGEANLTSMNGERRMSPYPFIQMNPQDMADIKVKAGDLVEVYNDNGSTQAMVYPTTTARRKETFMQFASPNGVQGNVVSPGVNELVIPNYKQTWAAIRKLSDAPEGARQLSFKSLEYSVG